MSVWVVTGKERVYYTDVVLGVFSSVTKAESAMPRFRELGYSNIDLSIFAVDGD